MGKQIEYYIEYEFFVSIAQRALDLGCKIAKEARNGKVIISDAVDIISKDEYSYYFYIPEAGKFKIIQTGEKERLDNGYSSSGITLIEATPTKVSSESKRIQRGRLFCISDYYDEDGQIIKRPDCVTKTYNSLVRYIKKNVPYVETKRTILKDGREFIYKDYVCDKYLYLKEKEGYSLV